MSNRSVYVIVKVAHTAGAPFEYWNKTTKEWTWRSMATQYTAEERATATDVEGGVWELYSDGHETLDLRCPNCNNIEIEEVMTEVTVTSPFTTVTLHVDEDFVEPDYGASENAGGQVQRYQCANCGHVVANSIEEFRTWVKQLHKK